MAEAVQELFPGTQVTIGPSIEDGFYYDFARDEPFSLDDLAKIEQRMKEIVDRDEPIRREVWKRDDAIAHFKSIGEHYKAEIIEGIPAGEDVSVYHQGELEGPLPRAAPAVDEGGRQGVQADEAGRRLLARRPAQRPAAADLRHGLGLARPTSRPTSTASRRPRSATTASIGRAMDLFHLQEEGQGHDVLAPQGLDALPDAGGLHAPPAGRRRLSGGEDAAGAWTASLWEKSGHWEKFGHEHVRLRDGGGRGRWPSSR